MISSLVSRHVVKEFSDKLKGLKSDLSNNRDKLFHLGEEIDELLNHCDEAVDAIEEAVDALSRLL